MNSMEIAKNQLDRLTGNTRRRRASRIVEVEIPAKEIKRRGRSHQVEQQSADPEPASDSISFDYKSITIEWSDENGEEIKPSDQSPPTPPTKQQVIKKKIVWDPATNGVVSTESELLAESPPSIKKRRTNEVDKLLGDEGVQVIMRDQQICFDDNGTLLNMQKPSKTRHQRMKQEEPEKTPNDWNVCSMIVRRRSSSFSTDSFVLQDTSTIAGSGQNGVTEKDSVQEILSPPLITNLFQSMKTKMNKTLSDNFDMVVLEETNNNVEMIRPQPPKQRSPKVVQNGTNKMKNNKTEAPMTTPITTKKAIPKKTTPPKKAAATAIMPPKMISVHSENEFVQLKILDAGLLSPEVCQELATVLEFYEENDRCNLVLLGPLKFISTESSNAQTADSACVLERRFLQALAKFTKPIIVAVQGNVEGLGVTMLPLFDLMFAKYGAEFCCAKDPLPGLSILMSSAKVDKNRMSEILFLGESATSTQAVNYGLITREISSKNDKDFEDKVTQLAKETLDGKYTERIRVVKRLWRESHLDQLLKDLNRESSL